MSRITFADASGNGSVASQTKIENLTSMAGKIKFADSLLANLPGDFTAKTIWSLDKGTVGSTSETHYIDCLSNGSSYQIRFHFASGGTLAVGYNTKASLPGTDVIFYFERIQAAGGLYAELFDTAGNSLGNTVTGTDNQAMETGAGTGAMTLHGNDQAADYDGFALYSAALAGSARWSVPAAGDANIVQLFGCDSATSDTDLTTGTAMTMANATLTGGGTWPAAGGGGGGSTSAIRSPLLSGILASQIDDLEQDTIRAALGTFQISGVNFLGSPLYPQTKQWGLGARQTEEDQIDLERQGIAFRKFKPTSLSAAPSAVPLYTLARIFGATTRINDELEDEVQRQGIAFRRTTPKLILNQPSTFPKYPTARLFGLQARQVDDDQSDRDRTQKFFGKTKAITPITPLVPNVRKKVFWFLRHFR